MSFATRWRTKSVLTAPRSTRRSTSFRARMSTLTALAVGVAVALAAIASFLVVSNRLYAQTDSSLTKSALSLRQVGTRGPLGSFNFDFRLAASLAYHDDDQLQIIDARGQILAAPPRLLGAPLKVTSADVAVAADQQRGVLHTITSSGRTYRVFTLPLGTDTSGNRLALEVAHPLGQLQRTLEEMKVILLFVAAGGVALAVALGYAVGKATIRPVVRLTAAAEHVTATQDLASRIDEQGDDELARLAHAFNTMLGTLEASRQQQAQLVSDAGHELRTPLTSLRTNIEFLMRAGELPTVERDELLGDVRAQLEELTTLIGDIVELARHDERQPEPTEVRLDHIVSHAVERAERRAIGLHFQLSLTPGSVRAQPALLERAVLNVLDNAAKWSPPGGTVEVVLQRLDRWRLEVRDHGPGIAAEDMPKVFDRFYRASTARSMPGSGLGLAIVRQVVTSHGGSVHIESPPGGGTLVRIELPTVSEDEADAQPPQSWSDAPPAQDNAASQDAMSDGEGHISLPSVKI